MLTTSKDAKRGTPGLTRNVSVVLSVRELSSLTRTSSTSKAARRTVKRGVERQCRFLRVPSDSDVNYVNHVKRVSLPVWNVCPAPSAVELSQLKRSGVVSLIVGSLSRERRCGGKLIQRQTAL